MVSLTTSRVQSLTCFRNEDPFIFSVGLVHQLQLLSFARKVLALSCQLLRPKRLSPARGRPDDYPDEVILVTVMVMAIWHLSPRTMVKRLRRWPDLASACRYCALNIISASQLYRRRDRLGLWVYFITFCALVWQLIQLGIIVGRDVVIDSTVIDAFSKHDLQAAWHFAKRFGYKVHMLICRDALLPVMFLITPANRNDAPWAVPLLEMCRRCFSFPIRVVRADAAYFTKHIIAYILRVLHAQPVVDINSRRRGKKALAILSFISWWRQARGERGYIERLFALLKRYYGLNDVQVIGLCKVWRHTFEVCIAVLTVAWLAVDIGRPELMHSKSRLLAPC